MQVGVYCSSIRPYFWDNLYKMLSNNDVDFNLCIAGPYSSEKPLPSNVKYIQTNVKPPQCWFIAAQNTAGDYVMSIEDDSTHSPGSLDDLVKLVDGKMTLASPKYSRIIDCGGSHYDFADKRVGKVKKQRKIITLDFPLPVNAMMHRDTFNDIGIDKNFIGVYWILDISFELVSRGGKIIISETSVISDFKTSGLCKSGGDYEYLTDMWFDGDEVRSKRKQPIDPLVYGDDVLIVSQGRRHPKWP